MLGTVTALYRYPVKALRAEPLARARVLPGGIAGDRACALFVTGSEHPRAGKTYRGKEHRLLHTVDTVAAAQAIALAAGIDLDPQDARPHYFDAEPVSLVFDVWLRELEALTRRSIDPLRFRPNVVAAAAPSFEAPERDLVGARLQAGDVAFDVVSAIVRCVTPSYDVATGDPDPALQRTLVNERGNIMGVYCRVAVPGTLEPGAAVRRAS